MLSLTEEQRKSLRHILRFLRGSNKLFLLQGNAGTGKSTIITQLLLDSTFIKKKIALCATTNKAVSVLEHMFPKKINTTFMTIHKLLKIKRVIDLDGKEQFVSQLDLSSNEDWKPNKSNKSIHYYDIIVIDECSMINNNLANYIVNLSKNIKGKIIFVGDSLQLPPINENISKVFSLEIPKYELREVVRFKNNINLLANDVKTLISNHNHKLKIKKYLGNGVNLYRKLDNLLESYISSYKNHDNPIILVYTNKKKDEINNKIRTILFNTKENFIVGDLIVFNKYYKHYSSDLSFYASQQVIIKEVSSKKITMNNLNFSDLINLKYSFKIDKVEDLVPVVNVESIMCPICLTEEADFVRQTPCHHYFCSGCILLWLEKNKTCPYCRMNIKDNNINIKNEDVLTTKINMLKNKTNDKSYKIKILYTETDKLEIIHEDSILEYKKDIEYIRNTLYDIKKFIDKNKLDTFKKMLLNRLWEFYYNNYIDRFADISYGYCITTHKSQGSTYKNVFVDMLNIVNTTINEHKFNCLYTAITRASNDLNVYL